MSAPQVLCVDDEALIRMMLADWVDELGLRPLEAGSGEEALAKLDQAEVDLLITDIRMEGISGWEVAEQARRRRPGLPVIYISGHPSPGDPVPDSIYLAKPFGARQLQDAVRDALELGAA
ncbi:response regulator [Sphingomonas sp. ID1715]|uniref:response regulator n=1 Tax=Sphingomonas sp. ID1715 TaxID=1656898 RepID=UPI001488B0EB|nr:response regulator [Sphingomonas sp. ID1715]NNM76270.1 response regulator [Sphingomonas sp. ID1715]